MTDEPELKSEGTMTAGGCYSCGSPQGAMTALCPACLQRNEMKRQQLKDALYVESSFRETPFLFRIHYYPSVQFLLVLVLFALVVTLYITFPDFSRETTVSILLRALRTTAAFVVIVTWVFFWVTLCIIEPIWGLASILLPFLVYKFVIMKWDEVKYVFVWNCAAMLTWLFAYAAYEQMYARYRPPGQHAPWAPFDRVTNPNFAMPELPDDTLMD